jgi:hypothetical protein
MPNPTITKPNYVSGPGFLYYAPLGTSLPANTVAGSVFTDAWTSPWVWLGTSTTGSVWHYNITTSPIEVAEILDPIAFPTTGRTATVDFNLASYTATNLGRALNGATLTVTGSSATTLTQIDPPAPGTETRFMLGWESLDATIRKIAFQVINSGDIAETFAKAPAFTDIPFNVSCEVPSSPNVPFRTYTAGVARG